ncbi:MAG: transposase, partial [Acidobacteria bacterium RBG_16_64_8]
VLLRAVDKRERIIERFSQCFTDHRNPDLIEHSVQELTAQRIYGIALGYEDLNDHDDLRRDPLLAVVVGKEDPTGANRRREQDRGKALGGKSTLNRLELTEPGAGPESRYKKIALNEQAVDRLLVEYFLDAVGAEPSEIVLDIDATNDPVHGEQEGRYFQGYYDQYCYLPLYIFCEEHLLLARLRPGWVDGPEGSVAELERIVAQIRQRWPNVHIIVRGDSAFAREEIMHWVEKTPGMDYVFGLAKNPRLERPLERTTFWARARRTLTGSVAREFDEFSYQTLDSWSRPRRVIGKAEVSAAGDNPRCVVTSLEPKHAYQEAQEIYEQRYCAR